MFMSSIVYVQLRTGLLETNKMSPLIAWVSLNSNSTFRRAFSNTVTPYANLTVTLLGNLNDYFYIPTHCEPIFKTKGGKVTM